MASIPLPSPNCTPISHKTTQAIPSTQEYYNSTYSFIFYFVISKLVLLEQCGSGFYEMYLLVVVMGGSSSGCFTSFFGADSCSSRFFRRSLSFRRLPGFSSLMSSARFLQSTSISNFRFNCKTTLV